MPGSRESKYQQLADTIVQNVGGRGNISWVGHCVTRLRFNVADKSKVNEDAIKSTRGVIDIAWAANQLQIIIGQSVGDAYDLVVSRNDLAGLGEGEAQGEKDAGEKKKFSIATVFEAIASCVTPVIPVLIGAGMINVIILILQNAGLVGTDDPTATFFGWVATAGFWYLPIYVGQAAAKRFNATPALGMLMGAMLVYPDFMSAVGAGEQLSIFGIPVYGATYSASVLPVILSVFVMSYVERFFTKISPELLRLILVPLGTIAVMVPVTFCALGPLGAMCSGFIATAFTTIHETLGFVGVGIAAALTPWIVLMGMHHALGPIIIDSVAKTGSESLMAPAQIVSNINQGAASLGVFLKSRDENVRETALGCAVNACLAGVTEPAMYGVNLKYVKPMIAATIGNFAGGCVAGLGAAAHAPLGSAGLVGGLPIFLGGNPGDILWEIAGIGVGFVVTLACTLAIFKPQDAQAEKSEAPAAVVSAAAPAAATRGAETLLQPVAGTPVELASVSDKTFASGLMGAGCAVMPSEGRLVAPAAGTVAMVFPTGHAVGIMTDAGNELLMHIGIDTVNLQGKFFSPKVAQGQRVAVGDVLVEFDLDAIRAAGYDPTTMVLVSDTTADDVVLLAHDAGAAGTELLSVHAAKEA